VDVPGINAKDIEVDVSGNLLTVRGSREEEKKSKTGGVWRHERHSGSFLRTVTLPTYVDSAKVEAKYDKGVLTITAPKIPGAGPKRVPVKTE
jgi:HSP20 family protein